MDGAATAMYYCADHGEDIFDDDQKRFLHSSPTVTYQQLHIASLAWFSTKYKKVYAHKVEAALKNADAPATTYSVFHTMADMADIASAYVAGKASLLSPNYDRKARRYYLNDHNHAVEFGAEIGLNSTERLKFLQHGIEL
jgi:lipid A ethanolaminephosphotransferase